MRKTVIHRITDLQQVSRNNPVRGQFRKRKNKMKTKNEAAQKAALNRGRKKEKAESRARARSEMYVAHQAMGKIDSAMGEIKSRYEEAINTAIEDAEEETIQSMYDLREDYGSQL